MRMDGQTGTQGMAKVMVTLRNFAPRYRTSLCCMISFIYQQIINNVERMNEMLILTVLPQAETKGGTGNTKGSH